MTVISLDGTKMTSSQKAHEHIAETLSFPLYYGANLDALSDCLSELGNDKALLIINPDAMEKNLGTYSNRILGLFREISSEPNSFIWLGCMSYSDDGKITFRK